jgi:hypothetical protein
MTKDKFTVSIPDDTLKDLRERLARTRFAPNLPIPNGSTAPTAPISIGSNTGGVDSIDENPSCGTDQWIDDGSVSFGVTSQSCIP